MVEDGSLRVLAILSHAASVIAEGEVLQLATAQDTTTSEDAYLEVIAAKNGRPIRGRLPHRRRLSASGHASKRRRSNSMARTSASPISWLTIRLTTRPGKPPSARPSATTFARGKITLPVILAFRRGIEEERVFWRRTLERGEREPSDFATAVALLEKHGSLARYRRARPPLQLDGPRCPRHLPRQRGNGRRSMASSTFASSARIERGDHLVAVPLMAL